MSPSGSLGSSTSAPSGGCPPGYARGHPPDIRPQDLLFARVSGLKFFVLEGLSLVPFLCALLPKACRLRLHPLQGLVTSASGNLKATFFAYMGDGLLSSAGAGRSCGLSMRLPDPSPVLDKNRAPMGPEILSSTGAGVWKKAPMAFPDSSSVLDKFQSTVGSFLLTVELFLLTVGNFSFFTYNWRFFAYNFTFLTYNWSFFAYSGKVLLIMALRDCKQRSLTVSKKTPTVSQKPSPIEKYLPPPPREQKTKILRGKLWLRPPQR